MKQTEQCTGRLTVGVVRDECALDAGDLKSIWVLGPGLRESHGILAGGQEGHTAEGLVGLMRPHVEVRKSHIAYTEVCGDERETASKDGVSLLWSFLHSGTTRKEETYGFRLSFVVSEASIRNLPLQSNSRNRGSNNTRHCNTRNDNNKSNKTIHSTSSNNINTRNK